MQRARLVNVLDRDRVSQIIAQSGTPPSHLRRLMARVDGARAVRPVHVPPDLVTMNSVVRVEDLDTGETDTYALCYDAPPAPEPVATPVTIHALVGSELLSRWVGESFEFEGRRRPVRLRIADIDYQPERNGDLTL